MAEGKMKQDWGQFLPTLLSVFIAFVAYGFLDKFVLSKIYGHLENLIEGEDE